VGNEDIIAKAGRAFDKVRRRLFSPNTEVLLLRPSTDAERDFEVVHQISTKWFFEYSEFRQNFLLEVALGDELTDPMNEATHIQVDDDVYEIDANDTIQPKGTDVTWKIFCKRHGKAPAIL